MFWQYRSNIAATFWQYIAAILRRYHFSYVNEIAAILPERCYHNHFAATDVATTLFWQHIAAILRLYHFSYANEIAAISPERCCHNHFAATHNCCNNTFSGSMAVAASCNKIRQIIISNNDILKMYYNVHAYKYKKVF